MGPAVYEPTDVALEHVRYFVSAGLWPPGSEGRAAAWLRNFERPSFDDDDRQVARELLAAYLLVGTRMTDALFAAAFLALSSALVPVDASWTEREAAWSAFRSAVIVSFPTDEVPNVTDSGYSFARRARYLMKVPQSRILSPADAVRRLERQPAPLVLVDDFTGSGNQMIDTWDRRYPSRTGETSLAELAALGAHRSIYSPILATSYAIDRLAVACPSLELRPMHRLPPEYGVRHPNTLLVSASISGDRVDRFLDHVANELGRSPGDMDGFHSLGLALGFEDAPPDATLPVYYAEEAGWNPLFVRR